jgi:hypothetical protein
MHCWFRPDNVTADMVIMGLETANPDSNGFFVMHFLGTVAGDPMTAHTWNGVTDDSASQVGVAVNQWNHSVCVFASTSSRHVVLNGSKATSSANVTAPAASIDNCRLGSYRGDALFADGRIADAAMWNVALSDDEIAALQKGYSPLLVRPSALVAYWPLVGRTSPEIDVRGGRNFTLTNSPTPAEHPRVIMPKRHAA